MPPKRKLDALQPNECIIVNKNRLLLSSSVTFVDEAPTIAVVLKQKVPGKGSKKWVVQLAGYTHQTEVSTQVLNEQRHSINQSSAPARLSSSPSSLSSAARDGDAKQREADQRIASDSDDSYDSDDDLENGVHPFERTYDLSSVLTIAMVSQGLVWNLQ
jgi:hypothetical protein